MTASFDYRFSWIYVMNPPVRYLFKQGSIAMPDVPLQVNVSGRNQKI